MPTNPSRAFRYEIYLTRKPALFFWLIAKTLEDIENHLTNIHKYAILILSTKFSDIDFQPKQQPKKGLKMKSKSAFTRMEVIVAIVFAIIVLDVFVPFGRFISPDKATRALTTQGYSDVKVVDRDYYFLQFRGGSTTDRVRFTCTAKNPAGNPVTIYVFSGWWKYSTIRTP